MEAEMYFIEVYKYPTESDFFVRKNAQLVGQGTWNFPDPPDVRGITDCEVEPTAQLLEFDGSGPIGARSGESISLKYGFWRAIFTQRDQPS
jgi:hypothetical protein